MKNRNEIRVYRSVALSVLEKNALDGDGLNTIAHSKGLTLVNICTERDFKQLLGGTAARVTS